jgi:hypothetical protein
MESDQSSDSIFILIVEAMGLIRKYKTYKDIAIGVDNTLKLAGIASAQLGSSILDRRVRAPLRMDSMSNSKKSEMARRNHKLLRQTLIKSGLKAAGSKRLNGLKARMIGSYIDRIQKRK